jgi:hypothetical protein
MLIPRSYTSGDFCLSEVGITVALEQFVWQLPHNILQGRTGEKKLSQINYILFCIIEINYYLYIHNQTRGQVD